MSYSHEPPQPAKKPPPVAPPSPKASGGKCLCSPTTHQGSFRCRYHRSLSSAWLGRSKSMPSAASKSDSAAGSESSRLHDV